MLFSTCFTEILLPIVGNAAEHLTAVDVALKNKMDLALGVALGSSSQISLLVVPFSVCAGWAIGVPMDLNFRPLGTGILLVTVLIVGSVTSDGEWGSRHAHAHHLICFSNDRRHLM